MPESHRKALQESRRSAELPGKTWRDADGIHIDVRGLAPPEPFVAIVRLVESVADETAVVVHHDRDPVLLYPELAERGWTAEAIAGDPGEVRLMLRRET